MKIAPLFLILSLIGSLITSAFSADYSPNVHILTDQNFTEATSSGKWFVMFYAPWCGHCTRLKPVWMDLADSLHEKVNIGMVDATVNRQSTIPFQIKGYPTLILMNENQTKEYRAARSLESLSQFALNELSFTNAESPKIATTKNEPKSFQQKAQEAYVHFSKQSKKMVKEFKEIKQKYPATLICLTEKVSLQLQEIEFSCQSKTKNDVFVTVNIAVEYKVNPEMLLQAFYCFEDVKGQLKAVVSDKLTSLIPMVELDDLFENHREMTEEVRSVASDSVHLYGYEVIKVLIMTIFPDRKVAQSMNNINKERRLRAAQFEKAEMLKANVVKDAEAKMVAKKLNGEGIAKQRQILIEGLKDCFVSFEEHQIDTKRVMQLLLVSQYLETLKDMARMPDTRCVFYTEHADDTLSNVDDFREILIQGMQGTRS